MHDRSFDPRIIKRQIGSEILGVAIVIGACVFMTYFLTMSHVYAQKNIAEFYVNFWAGLAVFTRNLWNAVNIIIASSIIIGIAISGYIFFWFAIAKGARYRAEARSYIPVQQAQAELAASLDKDTESIIEADLAPTIPEELQKAYKRLKK